MDEPAMARAFAEAGADAFLPKPVDLARLLAAVAAPR
jgi:DNA-binding response OmpR family regulator